MKKHLSILALLCAGMSISIPQVMAQAATAPKKEALKSGDHKTPVKKAVKKIPGKTTGRVDDGKQSDIAGFSGTHFDCELGNKITVYEKTGDHGHIKLGWNKQIHELKRVDTSTGANRFEDKATGLVWIHIPAKGMLLDSKKGQQLANECRSPQQMKAKKSKA